MSAAIYIYFQIHLHCLQTKKSDDFWTGKRLFLRLLRQGIVQKTHRNRLRRSSLPSRMHCAALHGNMNCLFFPTMFELVALIVFLHFAPLGFLSWHWNRLVCEHPFRLLLELITFFDLLYFFYFLGFSQFVLKDILIEFLYYGNPLKWLFCLSFYIGYVNPFSF